jgi:hypothetical protein
VDKIVLSVTAINQVLAYLGTRPYQEVWQLIDKLQEEAKNQPKEEVLE